MNTDQLMIVLQQHDSTRHGKVYPADKVPLRVLNRPQLYIVNTEPNGCPGKHWVAFYFPDQGPAEYFDSVGKPPRTKRFELSLKNNGPSYIYNRQRIQGWYSNTCGLYCLYYVMQRSRGMSMDAILDQFDWFDLDANDDFVTSFIADFSYMRI